MSQYIRNKKASPEIGPTTTLQCPEEMEFCECILLLSLLLLLHLPLPLTYLRTSTRAPKGTTTTSTAPRHPSSRICPITCLRCVSSPVFLLSPLSFASLSHVLLPTEMQLKSQCHRPTTQTKTSQTATPPPPMSPKSPSSVPESQAHRQPITYIN